MTQSIQIGSQSIIDADTEKTENTPEEQTIKRDHSLTLGKQEETSS